MTDDPKTADDSVSHAQRIDQLCDAFESAWNLDQRPKLEDALAQVSPTEQEQLLRELLPIEIFHRVKCGEQLRTNDYAARFPGLDAAWIEQVITQHASQRTAAFQPAFQPHLIIAGRYSLKQKLGEGGMGEVWVAKQTEPVKRNVALKLIKTGMDSRAVLARFEAERQALALMEHPNIARVLDGGITASGQPFFVMELVNGLPLNKFCDEAKLTLQQRLELFIPICQAVQHAHHKGIVHRDLKPSNILVTLIDGRPVPKVIDFGVAKATAGKLTDESLETQFGAVVGTLEYMSPEQAGYSGADIDTRADIYSLGVILYELLTGLRPIDAKRLKQAAYAEMIRIIKEEEPSKPSTRLSTDESLPSLAALRQTEPRKLMAILRGELDWVVMKCLEKDRNRRYETANSLARDIEHYLADEPVEARPPSTTYRLSKFLLRNKGPVLAASLLLLALVGGIVGTTWGMVRAEQHRLLAERQRALAEQAAVEERQAKEAETEQRKIATQQTAVAERQFRVAMATQLAAQSHLVRDDFPVRSTLLAVEAINTTRLHNEPVLPVAVEELRGALGVIGGQVLVRDEGISRKAALSSDGRWLVAKSADNTVKLWDLVSGGPDAIRVPQPARDETILDFKFIENDRTLETISRDVNATTNNISLWNLAEKPPFATEVILEHSKELSAAYHAIISPNGRWVAIQHSLEIELWDREKKASDNRPFRLLREYEAGITPSVITVFSPDSRWLAADSLGRAVILYDLAKSEPGTEPVILKRQQGSLIVGRAVTEFSRDGRWLASGYSEGTTLLWETDAKDKNDAAIVLPGAHHGAVTTIAFSPDGRLLATGSSDRTARVWDLAHNGNYATPVILRGHEGEVTAVAFSADSQRLVTASSDGSARLWDVTAKHSFTSPIVVRASTLSLAFSADGRWMATPSTESARAVELWDLSARDPKSACITLQVESGNESFAFSPDSRWLATGFGYRPEKGVTLWDLKAPSPGSDSKSLRGYRGNCTAMAFSPNGRWLVTSAQVTGPDGNKQVITLRNPANDAGTAPIELLGQGDRVRALSFSPDGNWLASPGDPILSDSRPRRPMRLWNLAALDRRTPIIVSDVSSPKFSPNSRWLASTTGGILYALRQLDSNVYVWDLAAKPTAIDPIVLRGEASPNFSPDNRRLATVNRDGTVRVWDIRGEGQPTPTVLFRGNGQSGEALKFSPQGRWLANVTPDGNVCLWDMTTESPENNSLELRGQKGPLWSLEFSPDGRWLALESNINTILWDISDENPQSTSTSIPLHGSGSQMKFSPDSRWLTTRGPDHGTVQLWPLQMDTLIELAREVASRDLSPDEKSQYGLDLASPDSERARLVKQTELRRQDQRRAAALLANARPKEPKAGSSAATNSPQRNLPGTRGGFFGGGFGGGFPGGGSGRVSVDPASPQGILSAAGTAYRRGTAHYEKGENEQAIAAFTEAIQLDQQYAAAFNARGLAYNKLGKSDQELADYDEAIRHYPEFASSWNNRGWVLWRTGKYDQAITALDEALRLNPNNALAYRNRGWTYYLKREYDRAIADYDRAVQLDPKSAEGWNDRGVIFIDMGQLDRALEGFDQAIKLDPAYFKAYYNRGRVFSMQGRYEGAVKEHKEALRQDPKYIVAHNALAALLASCPNEKVRNGKKAIEHATAACELTEWTFAAYLDTLAAAYAEAGDFEQAVKWVTKAIELATSSRKVEYKARLELYQSGKPYHQAPAAKP